MSLSVSINDIRPVGRGGGGGGGGCKGVHMHPPFEKVMVIIVLSWQLTQEETQVYNCDMRFSTMHDQ